MVKIALYDESATLRVAKKSILLLSKYRELKTTKDAIWLDGVILSFLPKLIIVNVYDTGSLVKYDIFKTLSFLLNGEEICVSDILDNRKYIKSVTSTTDFAIFFSDKEG